MTNDPAKLSSVSIVVPALNEEKTLARTVEWTLEVLKDVAPDHEVIVIDDGSTDATGRIADELARRHDGVVVIHHRKPTGFGGALNAGFRAASKDLVSLIPGDCEFWPTDLPRFIDEILRTGADVVTSTVPNRPLPFYRHVLSWGWRTCMKIFLGECPTLMGIFMVRRTAFARVSAHGTSGMWTMELLIRLRRAGARFSVIPMAVHPRADMRESKVANLRTTLKVLRDILELRGRLKNA
jgi:glycosyltransferase involved in cell wall biosynthesis